MPYDPEASKSRDFVLTCIQALRGHVQELHVVTENLHLFILRRSCLELTPDEHMDVSRLVEGKLRDFTHGYANLKTVADDVIELSEAARASDLRFRGLLRAATKVSG